MRVRKFAGLAAAAIIGLSLAGCVVERRPARVQEQIEIVATQPPPPLRAEIVLPPPVERERYVWVAGHWEWNGREHFWVAGRYIERPHRDAVWVEGRWIERGGNWVWTPGRWRS